MARAMRNVSCTFVWVFLAFSQAVYAQDGQVCTEAIVKQVGDTLKISDFSLAGGKIVSGACKVWPHDKNITLAAFAYDAGTQDEKKLVVAMLDNPTGKIIASYQGAIAEDAAMRVEADSFKIDTAPYDLAPGVRAFGLDVMSGYIANCGDGGLGPMRTLFVRDGNAVRPVLEGFYKSYWQFVQGGNPRCVGPDAPEPVIENFDLTIAIGKASSHGFANLLITGLGSLENGKKSKRKPFEYELRYDGKKYPLDAMEEAFSKWRD